MSRRTAALIGVGLVFIGVAVDTSGGDIHDRTTRSVLLEPQAVVSVGSAVGDVTIQVWNRPDVMVEIDRRAPSIEALARIGVSIERSGGALRVSALQSGNGRDERLRGSITIHAPATQRFEPIELFEGRLDVRGVTNGLRARVERGAITADGVDGPIRLETTIGSIRLRHGATTPADPVRLRTFNGDILLLLHAVPTNARILALSLGGTVRSDIPLRLKTGFGPRFGEASLGRGEPVLSMDAVNGDIRIEHQQ